MRGFATAAVIVAAAIATPAIAQRGSFGWGINKEDPKKAPPPKQDKIFPTKVSWVATSLNGKAFGGERPTFILDEQFRMQGFGSCNNFSATAYPLREQRLAVGPFALTKKSCDKARMDQERNFLIALRTSVQWDTVGGELVIKSQNGELRFQRSL
jgi:heat shock protein HslJ